MILELNAASRAATLHEMASARYHEALAYLRARDFAGYRSRLDDAVKLSREARRLALHQMRLDDERRKTARAADWILEAAARSRETANG